MSKCHCDDYYTHMEEENEKQVREATARLNGFDPEDPKVWKEADEELQKAAASHNPFESHPLLRATAYLLIVVSLGAVAGVVIALFMRFL